MCGKHGLLNVSFWGEETTPRFKSFFQVARPLGWLGKIWVPQRLKPHCKENTYGTAEGVPLSKTDFFSTLFEAKHRFV
jgi:hypothetical protein